MFMNLLIFECSNFRQLVAFKRSQQPKVELHGREMADVFCLKMPDFHVTFRNLLHAVNLRHRTDGFTSPLKEGVLRIFFFALKNPTASVGFEPANFGSTFLPCTDVASTSVCSAPMHAMFICLSVSALAAMLYVALSTCKCSYSRTLSDALFSHKCYYSNTLYIVQSIHKLCLICAFLKHSPPSMTLGCVMTNPHALIFRHFLQGTKCLVWRLRSSTPVCDLASLLKPFVRIL